MHMDPTLSAIAGFLLGAVVTLFGCLAAHSMTMQTVKQFYPPEPELVFEPETSTTSIEDHDIVISAEEEEE